MRKPHYISMSTLLLTLLMLSSIFSCQHKQVKTYEEEAMPMSAVEQELLKIVNPSTGVVPDGALMKALYEIQNKHNLDPNKYLHKKVFPFGWQPVNDFFANLAITRITYDPNNTQTFYFGTGEGWFNADAVRGAGVWKSTNGGKTWTQLKSTNNPNFYYCQDVAVHPQTSHVYVATRNAGLQRSTDGGKTWQAVLKIGAGAKVDRAADIEFTADGEIMVTMGIFNTDGIYFSTNGDSATWEKRMNGMPAQVHRIEIATAHSDPNRVYAIPISSLSADDRKIKGIFRSDDKGLSWHEVNNPKDDYNLAKKQGWYDLIIKVDPENENHIVAGGLNLWRSRDGGINWEELSQGNRSKENYVHVDQHEITFLSKDTIYFGNDGGIYKCDNFQSIDPNIYNVNNTYNVTQFYATDIHPEINHPFLLGGTQDNGSIAATEADVSDFKRVSGADGSFCVINHKNGEIYYTTTQYNRVYRTKYGYMDTITNSKPEKDDYLFINPITIDPNNPEILYQPTSSGTYKLTNASTAGKDDWELAIRGWGEISAIAVSKNQPNIIFIARTSGAIFRFYDTIGADPQTRPTTISKNIGLTNAYPSCIFIDPNDANHLMVTYSNYGVESIWETRNALEEDVKWISHEGDLPDMPVRWAQLHPDKPNVCYIATELGVFYTDKLAGQNTKWLPTNKGLAHTRVDMLKLRPIDKTLVAATHGRGLFTAQIKTNTNEVIWTERGPQNVGGRTRTIMVDPNDPTHKKIWAGSVAGGLWVINNIDEVEIGTELNIGEFDITTLKNPIDANGTTILYEVSTNSTVKILLFDLNGKLMETIVDKNTNEGTHFVKWHPSYPYKPGSYIIALVADGRFKKSKKVLML